MYVWLGGIALQGALAAVVLLRKVWRELPFFAIYFLSNLTLGCLLYLMAIVHLSRNVYFYSHWSSQCVVLILGLGVVFEIFNHLFAPYAGLKKTVRMVFTCVALLLMVCAAVVMVARPGGEPGVSALFLAAEEAFRLLEVGLVALLFLSADLFGLPWRRSEFGIALGMGIYAISDLVTTSLRAYFGSSAMYALNIGTMLAFDFSLLIWISYLSPRQELSFLTHPEAQL